MTVKASGSSLSLDADVLPHLPVGATGNGTQNIGSVAVSMSSFRIGSGGLPASGAISFSDFYGVDNSVSTTRNTETEYSISQESGGVRNTATTFTTRLIGSLSTHYATYLGG
jgi:hypothetical protein